jgi:diguanylate cyclase (GGDEF)-like protein
MTIRKKIVLLVSAIALLNVTASFIALSLFGHEKSKVKKNTLEVAGHVLMNSVQEKTDGFLSRVSEEISNKSESETAEYFKKKLSPKDPELGKSIAETVFILEKSLIVYPGERPFSAWTDFEKRAVHMSEVGGGSSYYEDSGKVYLMYTVRIPRSECWYAIRIDITEMVGDLFKVFEPTMTLLRNTAIGGIVTVVLILVLMAAVSYPMIRKIEILEKELTSKNEELTQINLLLNVEVGIRKNIESELKAANRELKHISTIDQLTKLSNRRQFDIVFEREWQIHLREKRHLAVLMCDIDFFKMYNDRYGHPKGDHCLSAVASIIRNECHRPSDFAARYGGEEFVIILPETDTAGASAMADNICKAVAAKKINHSASPIEHHVTVSIGAASMIPYSEASRDVLLKKADDALYHAKKSGRNRSSTGS